MKGRRDWPREYHTPPVIAATRGEAVNPRKSPKKPKAAPAKKAAKSPEKAKTMKLKAASPSSQPASSRNARGALCIAHMPPVVNAHRRKREEWVAKH
ncbi:hypothetical protein NDU88_001407 [Pleurodeles waltl]|uniref:Uncharacterized protein n=1 Tax=Pleurodeles waltl TaxID=8319 RepID=A0AAV7U740_PLEWA|nr:hypothetical protein NDU88_001407 [Pleurodeles waltl]